MGKVRLEPVVLEDEGLEDVLEVLIGVGIAGVDAAVLVVELDGACDGLKENNPGLKAAKSKVLCNIIDNAQAQV